MGPQSCGSLSYGPSGSLGTKCHLDVVMWPAIEYTIRGKVVASPKSELW
jgi:hypothetical protein